MSQPRNVRMGWLPGYPDFRDYSPERGGEPPEGEPRVEELLDEVGVRQPPPKAQLPSKVDLRDGFSPVEDQEDLGSCTANAGVALLEFLERAAGDEYVDASRLFLDKATRDLWGWSGDSGAFLRTTMKAMVLFGIPPESYWPYEIANFEVEPSAFCYAFGQNYKSLQYYRLDPPGSTPGDVLLRVKTNAAAHLPTMFGFTVYTSVDQTWSNGGAFPFPTPAEHIKGGHAVVVAGYDDGKTIANGASGQSTKGALLIRNSWGVDWGEGGYGWLPYRYVDDGLAEDWWSLIKSSWVSEKVFGLDKH